MRRTILGLLLLGLAAAAPTAPATAETAPQASTDFEGDWLIDGQAPMKLRYSAARGMIRVDVSNPGGRAIVLGNITTGEVLNWSPDLPAIAMRMHTAPLRVRDASRTGETKTIAGERCTVWQGEGATVCFTGDGIWIEGERAGTKALIHNLERKAQPAGLFTPPAGMTIMDMPANMGQSMGLGLPGGGFGPL